MKTQCRAALLIAAASLSLTGCINLDDYIRRHEVTPSEPTTPQKPEGEITIVDPPPEGEPVQPGGSQGIEGGEEDDPNGNSGGIVAIEKFDVTGITPSQGATDGGYTVQIQGKQFDEHTTVQFGATPSPLTRNMSRYVLRSLVPSGHRGCVDVTVMQGDGAKKTLEKAFCYTETLALTEAKPDFAVEHAVTPVRLRGRGLEEKISIYARSGGETRRMTDVVFYGDYVEAILPDLPPGPVDILVSTPTGHSELAGALTILPELSIQAVTPNVLRAGQKTSLDMTGRGFLAAPVNLLAGTVSAKATPVSDTHLSASVTLPFPGCYDLVLFDDLRQSRLDKGLYVVDDTDVPMLHGIMPDHAPIEGGTATLVGTQIPENAEIYLGALRAEVVSRSEHGVEIQVPPVSSPQTVHVSAGDMTLENAFTYYAVPRFSSLTPDSGHAGDTVILTGANFNDTLRVFSGPYEVTEISVTNATRASLVMPAGSGSTRLTAIQDGVTADTRMTFQYLDAPAIFGLTPARIPVIGGSTVAMHGEGFSEALSLYVADTLVTAVDWKTPNYATFVSPPHATGDVSVELKDSQGQTVARTSVEYYEPGGLNTHLSGNRLEGRLNVTVLTVNTNKVIPDADVYVGTSAQPADMLHKKTNASGQASFESELLTGSQILYACAPQYSCNTIQTFNAQDVTIYLESWAEEENSSTSTPPPPTPPPDNNPTINPIDVTVLKPAEDSFITGKVSGFGKVALESDPNVIRAAKVIQSQLGPYTNTNSTDTVLILDENGTYRIKARRGDVALGLVCGLYNKLTGAFDPRYFGIRTGLYITNGVTLTADLTCPLPLNQTQSIKMLNIPDAQSSRLLSSAAYLNLGNFGYLGGFMTGTSETDLVVITRVPPLRENLEGVTLALQTSLILDNTYRGTIYSYDVPKTGTTVEVGPVVSMPVFDPLPDENYHKTATNTVMHNGEALLRRGVITWKTPHPEHVDFYAVTIRGYYAASTKLLWQFYLPGNATSIEFPERDYLYDNASPNYIYVTLTAYKSIFDAYDFNAFSTLDTKSAYVDSSASTSLYIPWETYPAPSSDP